MSERRNMGEGRTIDFTVLMAGAYPFRRGKRINVRKEGDLFFVSSDGQDFGLVKEVQEADVRMPDTFDGIVTESRYEQHILKARALLDRSHSFQAL